MLLLYIDKRSDDFLTLRWKDKDKFYITHWIGDRWSLDREAMNGQDQIDWVLQQPYFDILHYEP
jgi:hypothetical protein